MFEAIDEVLRQLLIREIPIKNKEIEIAFEQPRREWSARLSRPTINLFLFDIRENRKLRGSEQWITIQNPDNTATQKRAPVRVNLNYLITVWTEDPEDEHNLLTRALMALLRYASLPRELLPEALRSQPAPIMLQVAQEEILPKPMDLWGVLDNEMRTGLALTVTMSLDPYIPMVTRVVRTREIRFGQRMKQVRKVLVDQAGVSAYWSVGGRLKTARPLESLELKLLETGVEIPIQPEGTFTVGHLRAGEYTLCVSTQENVLKEQKITVPSPDCEIVV